MCVRSPSSLQAAPALILIKVLTFIRSKGILTAHTRSESRGDAMENQQHDEDGARIGDKVRIRSGIHAKLRGVVQVAGGESLEIRLDDGPLIYAGPEAITNYSLAARRAWRVMPKQAGRHQLDVPRKRMVSLRLDIDVLDDLEKASAQGLILNKEQAVNEWLRQHLDMLLGGSAGVDSQQE